MSTERRCLAQSYGDSGRPRYECDWCGCRPPRLYAYGPGRGREFCNVECAESFYGHALARPIVTVAR